MRKLVLLLLPSLALAQGVQRSVVPAIDTVRPAIDSGLRKYKPILSDDANTVSHLYFDKDGWHDTKSVTWATQGSPAAVAKNGSIPWGEASSGSAYRKLGTGSDVLDFAGDFTGVIIFNPGANTQGFIFTNGANTTAGYGVALNTLSDTRLYFWASGSSYMRSTGGPVIANTVNVVCFGRASGTAWLVWNGGTAQTGSITNAITPATGVVAAYSQAIGGVLGGMAFTLHETWFSTTTPTAEVCSNAASQVKSKLGITAW